ncbi:hypothetical protein POM88_002052 [Heracleum sosnowskyi]|uniref:Uncharacterized protein n=1 Tax=Heracleum sosnowskyi TaxID=360622 RepID=A0AAD8JHA7_9APIA|nr:hypothetical protein POM88_002052 [Heracleum sosnowskyi]
MVLTRKHKHVVEKKRKRKNHEALRNKRRKKIVSSIEIGDTLDLSDLLFTTKRNYLQIYSQKKRLIGSIWQGRGLTFYPKAEIVFVTNLKVECARTERQGGSSWDKSYNFFLQLIMVIVKSHSGEVGTSQLVQKHFSKVLKNEFAGACKLILLFCWFGNKIPTLPILVIKQNSNLL